MKTPWVILDIATDPPVGRRERCGETCDLKLPTPITAMVKRINAFIVLHKDCLPEEE